MGHEAGVVNEAHSTLAAIALDALALHWSIPFVPLARHRQHIKHGPRQPAVLAPRRPLAGLTLPGHGNPHGLYDGGLGWQCCSGWHRQADFVENRGSLNP